MTAKTRAIQWQNPAIGAHHLIISFADEEEEWQHTVLKKLNALASCSSDQDALPTTLLTSNTWLISSAKVIPGETPSLRLTMPAKGPLTTTGEMISEESLASSWQSDAKDLLNNLLPPAAVFAIDENSNIATAATDVLGIQQIYFCKGKGWAASSSSAMLLAMIGDFALDWPLYLQSVLIGYPLPGATSFREVQQLQGGHLIELQQGELQTNEYSDLLRKKPCSYLSRADSIESGVEVMKRVVMRRFEAQEETFIELSGGLDCRMILAAIPASERHRLHALTLANGDDADSRCAKKIAQRFDIRHDVLQIHEGLDDSLSELMRKCHRAAKLRQFQANPLSSALLLQSESSFPEGPRLSGANGEFARGVYYLTHAQRAAPDRKVVESVVNWQFVKPDNLALFRKDLREEILADAHQAFWEFFQSKSDYDWYSALDEYYLSARLQRWVGLRSSSAAQRRIIHMPFLDPEFIGWVRSIAPLDRRASKMWCQVLHALDPMLGSMPTDSGPSPRDLFDAGLSSRIKRSISFCSRAYRKLTKHWQGKAADELGIPRMMAQTKTFIGQTPGCLEQIIDSGQIEANAIEGIRSGQGIHNAEALSALLNAQWILAATGR